MHLERSKQGERTRYPERHRAGRQAAKSAGLVRLEKNLEADLQMKPRRKRKDKSTEDPRKRPDDMERRIVERQGRDHRREGAQHEEEGKKKIEVFAEGFIDLILVLTQEITQRKKGWGQVQLLFLGCGSNIKPKVRKLRKRCREQIVQKGGKRSMGIIGGESGKGLNFFKKKKRVMATQLNKALKISKKERKAGKHWVRLT